MEEVLEGSNQILVRNIFELVDELMGDKASASLQFDHLASYGLWLLTQSAESHEYGLKLVSKSLEFVAELKTKSNEIKTE